MGLFKKRDAIASYKTMFGRLEVAKTHDVQGCEILVMRIDGSLQSAAYTDTDSSLWTFPPFAYIRAFDHMFQAEADGTLEIRRVLMLGGGAFSYPKWLLTQDRHIRMDVVEVDPAVVEIARKHFLLDRLAEYAIDHPRNSDSQPEVPISRLAIHTCDAMEYLDGCTAAYSVVINDTYQGADIYQPLLESTGIEAVKRCLEPGGLYMTNVSVDLTSTGTGTLFRFKSELSRHFGNIYIIDACDEGFGGADNYIVIATDGEYSFTDVVPY